MTIPKIMEIGAPNLMYEAVSALEAGEFIMIPTDTVYGLAVRADCQESVSKLFHAKERSHSKKLAYLVSCAEDIKKYVSNPPNKAMLLAKRFWPGQLTLIIKEQGETLGFRCPAFPFALILAKTAKFPIFLTSANVSGEPAITSVLDAVSTRFLIPPAMIVDGGTTQYEKQSTIVMVTEERVSLMRAGCIPASRIPFLDEI